MSAIRSGFGPPKNTTQGEIGDIYIDQSSNAVYKCTSVTPGAPLDYGFIDVHQGHTGKTAWLEITSTITPTDGDGLFFNGSRLDWLGRVDTSLCTSFADMFANSYSKLTDDMVSIIETLNSTNVNNFSGMFDTCDGIHHAPRLNTVNGINFTQMFMTSTNLETVPRLDTAKGKNFYQMFMYCFRLKTVSGIDLSSATNTAGMFDSCKALTDLSLYNIRTSLTIGSGSYWGHLLTVDSLVHTIQELCTVETTQTLTIGTANMAKISGLYCRVLDRSTEKIDMVLCTSADDGAMSISDYAALKNWSIK